RRRCPHEFRQTYKEGRSDMTAPFKEAGQPLLVLALAKGSGDVQRCVSARQLYYLARALVHGYASQPLRYDDFCQGLLQPLLGDAVQPRAGARTCPAAT